MFIVIDGIDGAGTSTHSKILAAFLEENGFKTHLTQEPSNSEIGILLRKYLKDKRIPPSCDALLFAADRDIHYHLEIVKKLEEGHIVISDRYIESSIVYQSAQSKDISMEWVKSINKFAGKPDLTIILDLDPRVALARKSEADKEKFEEVEFLNEVRQGYLQRAKEENYLIINSDNVLELVQEKIQSAVLELMKKFVRE